MLIVVPFTSCTGLPIVAVADLRYGDLLSEKSCVHKLIFPQASGLGYWNFFSFDIFETHSDNFLGCFCVLGMLNFHGSIKYLILVFMFLKYVIFCVYP